jgi:hypothetical protein
MALMVDTTCLHKMFPLPCIGVRALGSGGWVCSINFNLIFYPISMHVRALSKFVLHIFLFSPAELAWSQDIK